MSTVSSGEKLKELSSSVDLFTRLAYFKMFLLKIALNLVWSLRFHHPAFFSWDQNFEVITRGRVFHQMSKH